MNEKPIPNGEIRFFRAYSSSHNLSHASKDTERTLCGLSITNTWAAVDEGTFKVERPCPECQAKLAQTMRTGKQTTL